MINLRKYLTSSQIYSAKRTAYIINSFTDQQIESIKGRNAIAYLLEQRIGAELEDVLASLKSNKFNIEKLLELRKKLKRSNESKQKIKSLLRHYQKGETLRQSQFILATPREWKKIQIRTLAKIDKLVAEELNTKLRNHENEGHTLMITCLCLHAAIPGLIHASKLMRQRLIQWTNNFNERYIVNNIVYEAWELKSEDFSSLIHALDSLYPQWYLNHHSNHSNKDHKLRSTLVHLQELCKQEDNIGKRLVMEQSIGKRLIKVFELKNTIPFDSASTLEKECLSKETYTEQQALMDLNPSLVRNILSKRKTNLTSLDFDDILRRYSPKYNKEQQQKIDDKILGQVSNNLSSKGIVIEKPIKGAQKKLISEKSSDTSARVSRDRTKLNLEKDTRSSSKHDYYKNKSLRVNKQSRKCMHPKLAGHNKVGFFENGADVFELDALIYKEMKNMPYHKILNILEEQDEGKRAALMSSSIKKAEINIRTKHQKMLSS